MRVQIYFERLYAQNDTIISCDSTEIIEIVKSSYYVKKILPEDLVFIGVRDTELQEDEVMKALNIKNHSVSEVNQKGVQKIVAEIETQLSDCDIIYISFDVDSMDPTITSHGTGTPVDNGLTPKQAEDFLTLLTGNEKTVCIEFVEVNPCLDEKTNKMAEVTAELLELVIDVLKK